MNLYVGLLVRASAPGTLAVSHLGESNVLRGLDCSGDTLLLGSNRRGRSGNLYIDDDILLHVCNVVEDVHRELARRKDRLYELFHGVLGPFGICDSLSRHETVLDIDV